jgi:hypothetical protein
LIFAIPTDNKNNTNKSTTNNNQSSCKGLSLNEKNLDNIRLVVMKDRKEQNWKEEYTKDELSGLSYSVKIKPDDSYYLGSQICQGDRAISFLPFASGYLFKKNKNGNELEHTKLFKDHINLMDKNKKYQIYSYYSKDKEN